MSRTHPTNDDLHDAVTDRLLAEALGGEAPPDRRDAIVERFEAGRASASGRFTLRKNLRRDLAWLSVAALLLVGTTLTLQRSVQNPRVAKLAQPPVDSLDATTESKLVESAAEPPIVAGEELGVPAEQEQRFSSGTSVPSDAGVVGQILIEPSPTVREQRQRFLDAFAVEPDLAGQGAGKTKDTTQRRKLLKFSEIQSQAIQPLAASPATPLPPASASASGRGRSATPGRVPGFAWGERYQLGYAGDDRRFRESGLPSGDRYEAIQENPFVTARGGDAVSTFSIDVDTASYANVRQHLLGMNRLPPADAVRIEELVNYFDYDYAGPDAESETPFAAAMEVGPCPWRPEHRLVRIGVKGREIETGKRPLSNLVFLVDVSGSMSQPNKLPLLVDGLKRLTRQLGENDRVAIVVYASSEGVALPSTSGAERGTILAALDRLRAGGSTAGGAGIRLAYDIAERNFIPGGVNRVLLCTDGDFNVGLTGTEALGDLVERKARDTRVFLSVLGFGRGNLNDAMMETISGRGNGVYAYIDSDREAHRVLVRQMSGTLVTIAKDVKLQVEFNPARVTSYRLIGYENRLLRTEDFNDDTKDAGEIGAGHTMTALYEVVPAGAESAPVSTEPLKYQPAEGSGQTAEEPTADRRQPTAVSDEMLTLKIRYKRPDGDTSTKLEFPLVDDDRRLSQRTADFQFASAVAEFGMLLRGSRHKGVASFDGVLERAAEAVGADPHGDRSEFIGLVRAAKTLRGE